jgi:AcrR family transcriptional regulator
MAALIDRERRARAKARKAAATDAIVSAARRAFETKALSGLSLPVIGQMAGVPAGKPELYFGSLEELFLLVLGREQQRWISAVEAAIDEPPTHLTVASAGDRLANSLVDFGLLARMWSLAPQVFESRVDVSVAIAAANDLHGRLEVLGGRLAERCDGIAGQDGPDAVRRCLDVAGALHSVCHPSGANAMAAVRHGEAPAWDRELRRLVPAVLESYASAG